MANEKLRPIQAGPPVWKLVINNLLQYANGLPYKPALSTKTVQHRWYTSWDAHKVVVPSWLLTYVMLKNVLFGKDDNNLAKYYCSFLAQ